VLDFLSKSSFKHEDVFVLLLDKNNRVYEVIRLKNISKNPNEFRVRKIEMLQFLFKNIIFCHVHNNTEKLSQKDKDNMYVGEIWGIYFMDSLYIYKKISKTEIERVYFLS
jgi:DNA repair protein RadC